MPKIDRNVCSVWVDEETEWRTQREQFRADQPRARSGPMTYSYPDHLAGPFPTFGSWLNKHVRTLRSEGFPISSELSELHCPPSNIALSFKTMWAYECHYRSNSESHDSYVSFDSGVASVSTDASSIDVGIVKDILLITYGKLNCVLMEADWIKAVDQGRAAVRKDRLGFWSVLFDARDRSPQVNPFVFPGSVSQVYFMDDEIHAGWKIVLRHDARSRRETEEKDSSEFDFAGDCYPPPNGDDVLDDGILPVEPRYPVDDVVRETEYVHVVDKVTEVMDEDDFLDDADYEEEIALQYVE